MTAVLARLWAWLRRPRRGSGRRREVVVRRPPPAAGPPDAGASRPIALGPPARPAVTVVDATGRGRHSSIPSLLGNRGYQVAEAFRADPIVLLLLSVSALPGGEPATADVALEIEREPLPARPTKIVVVWFVDEEAREELAAPSPHSDHPGEAGNGAPILLGTAWVRELAHHGGDRRAAARCHGRRVRWLLDAPNALAAGNARPAAIHRDIARLDARFTLALCPGVGTGGAGDESSILPGGDSVAAAIELRLGQ